MKKRLILAAFAALAFFAGPAAIAATNPADPPGLNLIAIGANEIISMADKMAATMPDKRFGVNAIAIQKEPQYSSVVGSNADTAGGATIPGEKLAGINKIDKVRMAGHINSGFSPGIGAGSGGHSAADNVLSIGIGGGSGGAVAAYSIAGIKTS